MRIRRMAGEWSMDRIVPLPDFQDQRIERPRTP
jgi:hypothetical protein